MAVLLHFMINVHIPGYGVRTCGTFGSGEGAMGSLDVFKERHRAKEIDSDGLISVTPYLYIFQLGKEYVNGHAPHKKLKSFIIDTNREPAAWVTAQVEAE